MIVSVMNQNIAKHADVRHSYFMCLLHRNRRAHASNSLQGSGVLALPVVFNRLSFDTFTFSLAVHCRTYFVLHSHLRWFISLICRPWRFQHTSARWIWYFEFDAAFEGEYRYTCRNLYMCSRLLMFSCMHACMRMAHPSSFSVVHHCIRFSSGAKP